MNHSHRQLGLASLAVIFFAAVVAACGQQVNSSGEPAADARSMQAAPRTTSLLAANVCEADDPLCVPSGAHAKHTSNCTVCHAVAGRLAFQIGGPAFPTGWVNGQTRPSFNAETKTCSNVACHGVPAGTFSYYFPGNDDLDGDGYPDAELKTVNYGGTMAAITPSWYAQGAGCTACHGNPPLNGSDGSNAWHTGNHANSANYNYSGTIINGNQCELCHNVVVGTTYNPIAQSVFTSGAFRGVSILLPSFHGNGLNVNALFKSQCFGCH